MKTPTEFQINQLMHAFDKKLPVRTPSQADTPPTIKDRGSQNQDLAVAIQNLERKLQKLEQVIKQKEQEAALEDRKSKAKKERAAKEKNKPKTAAEKAKIDRENKRSSAGSQPQKDTSSGASLAELKTLATRVKGQLAVAKQKLAAL